jgi:hypothetical protein
LSKIDPRGRRHIGGQEGQGLRDGFIEAGGSHDQGRVRRDHHAAQEERRLGNHRAEAMTADSGEVGQLLSNLESLEINSVVDENPPR